MIDKIDLMRAIELAVDTCNRRAIYCSSNGYEDNPYKQVASLIRDMGHERIILDKMIAKFAGNNRMTCDQCPFSIDCIDIDDSDIKAESSVQYCISKLNKITEKWLKEVK